jgi:stage V sporulation protein SpoVS
MLLRSAQESAPHTLTAAVAMDISEEEEEEIAAILAVVTYQAF